MTKEYSGRDGDAGSTGIKINKSDIVLAGIDLLILAGLLFVFLRGCFVTKMLFENGMHLLTLVIVWVLIFIDRLLTVFIKSDAAKKVIKIFVFVAAVAVFAGEMFYANQTTEFFYLSESTDASDFITARDVFGDDAEIHKYPGTGNCRKQSPFPGTYAVRVNQYFEEGRFCSLRVESFRWVRKRFQEEVIDQLSEKYGDSLLLEENNGSISGLFQEENMPVHFLITEREGSQICVFIQGDSLIDLQK